MWSSMAVTSAPAALPVQQRAWATRTRILDATVHCLAVYGYSGTTTVRVLAEAGVSRGSLLHQFHSREELLAATVQHLAGRTTEFARQACSYSTRRLSSGKPSRGSLIDAAVDSMWAALQQPLFAATTEIWIAARTNDELRRVLQCQSALGPAIVKAIESIFGSKLASSPNFQDLRRLLLSSMRGIYLSYASDPTDFRSNLHLDIWKRLARSYLEA
jgi:AcrR family transcriptional regulator